MSKWYQGYFRQKSLRVESGLIIIVVFVIIFFGYIAQTSLMLRG